MEVLHSKHPEAHYLTASILEAYRGKPLAMVPVYINNVMVAIVAGRLSEAEGPVGADLVILQHWLLRFGAENMGLRQIFGELWDWMAKYRPTWAAYRALMLRRLIGLDK